ncbi:MAG: hypothetical protein V1770_05420 [bacterium]
MKLYKQLIIFIAIFLLAILVWNSAVLFKGYGFSDFTPDQSLSRNLLETGKFSIENRKNVMLGSERIAKEGEISSRGNSLNPILSAYIYKFTELPNQTKAIFISSVINALALLFFGLTVRKIYGIYEAVVFSSVYIFLPVIWITTQTPIFYEFSLFFMALALFFYFSADSARNCPTESSNSSLRHADLTELRGKNLIFSLNQMLRNLFRFTNEPSISKHATLEYILTGVFLALSFLARDAMALFAPAFFIWLLLNNKKAILPIFSSLAAVILFFTIAMSMFTGKGINNNQHLTFFNLSAENSPYSDFGFYGHLYPDPYTFHFEKDEFLEAAKERIKSGGMASIDQSKSLANVGEAKISILQRIQLSIILLLKHISRFVSLEDVGGPFVTLFLLFGLWHVRSRKNKLWQFSLLWIGSVIFLLSFVVLAQRQHMMDFGFILALLIGLGIIEFAELLKKALNFKMKASYIVGLLSIAFIYQFVLTAHIAFSRAYDNSNLPRLKAYAEAITDANVSDSDVIAVGLNSVSINTLNYLANKSLVKFDSRTVEKLLDENKLKNAFDEFGITQILGFTPELTEKISRQANVKTIADNTIKPYTFSVSPTKSLFMNLIK